MHTTWLIVAACFFSIVLGAEDVVNFPLSEWWRLASREARHHRLEVFNKALERACRRHRNQNRSVIFISLNDAILDENNGVKPLFKDINPVNLHLLWEPLIVLWAEKLSSLNIGISPHMLVDMKRSASAYVSRKAQEVGDQVFAIGPRLRVIMDYLQEHSDIAKETTEADKRIIEKESRVSAPVVKEYTTHVDKDKAAFGDWRRQGGNTVTTSNNRSRRGSDNSTEKSTSEINSSLSYQLKDTSSHRMTSRTSSIDYSNGGSLLPTHSNNSNTINYGKVNSPSSSSGGGRTYEIATTSNADTDNMRASLSRRNSRDRDGAPEPSPRSHTGGSPRKEQLQLQSPRTDRRRGSDPESEGQTAQNQHTAPWTGRERGQRDVQGQGQGIDGGQGRKEKEPLRMSEDQPQSKGRQERQKLRPQTLSDRFKSYADTQGEEHSGGSAPRLIQPFEEMMRHKDGEGGGGLMQRGGGRDDGRHRGNRDGERDRDRERHVRR